MNDIRNALDSTRRARHRADLTLIAVSLIIYAVSRLWMLLC